MPSHSSVDKVRARLESSHGVSQMSLSPCVVIVQQRHVPGPGETNSDVVDDPEYADVPTQPNHLNARILREVADLATPVVDDYNDEILKCLIEDRLHCPRQKLRSPVGGDHHGDHR